MKIPAFPSSSLAVLASVFLGFCAAERAAGAPRKDGRETLSRHSTVARFDGVAYQRCMGLTSACPDHCGNSGDFAAFGILKYLAYEKPGEYGDPQQAEYRFQVEDNRKNPKAPEGIRNVVAGLAKGDFVLLDWRHDYVTKAGSSSPERVCTKLQKITREEADRITGGLDKFPAPASKPKPGIAPRAF